MFGSKQLSVVFNAYTARKGERITLATDTMDFGVLDTERFAVSDKPASIVPHAYVTGTGASAVTITVKHEAGAIVRYADGRRETMRRNVRMGELIFDEYARNSSRGAVVYRTVSAIVSGGKRILEESIMVYPGATVSVDYKPTARSAKLSVTKTGAFKPRKVSAFDCALMFARSMCKCYLMTAHANGTDGTHFECVPHIHNSAVEAPTVVHDSKSRKRSMSGAQRRKLRKLRAQANA